MLSVANSVVAKRFYHTTIGGETAPAATDNAR